MTLNRMKDNFSVLRADMGFPPRWTASAIGAFSRSGVLKDALTDGTSCAPDPAQNCQYHLDLFMIFRMPAGDDFSQSEAKTGYHLFEYCQTVLRPCTIYPDSCRASIRGQSNTLQQSRCFGRRSLPAPWRSRQYLSARPLTKAKPLPVTGRYQGLMRCALKPCHDFPLRPQWRLSAAALRRRRIARHSDLPRYARSFITNFFGLGFDSLGFQLGQAHSRCLVHKQPSGNGHARSPRTVQARDRFCGCFVAVR